MPEVYPCKKVNLIWDKCGHANHNAMVSCLKNLHNENEHTYLQSSFTPHLMILLCSFLYKYV